MRVRSVPGKNVFDRGEIHKSTNFNLKTFRLNDENEVVYFATIISKKKDKLATHRNRTRRILREAFRHLNLEGFGGMAFVIIPHESGMGQSLEVYMTEIDPLLNRIRSMVNSK